MSAESIAISYLQYRTYCHYRREYSAELLAAVFDGSAELEKRYQFETLLEAEEARQQKEKV